MLTCGAIRSLIEVSDAGRNYKVCMANMAKVVGFQNTPVRHAHTHTPIQTRTQTQTQTCTGTCTGQKYAYEYARTNTHPPMAPTHASNVHTHALRKATLKASETSASSHERLRAGRLMGKGPEWKESLQQARLRYVKRYLDYLRRARHTKKNCLLVTHGHMVQACASVLPANQHRKIV